MKVAYGMALALALAASQACENSDFVSGSKHTKADDASKNITATGRGSSSGGATADDDDDDDDDDGGGGSSGGSGDDDDGGGGGDSGNGPGGGADVDEGTDASGLSSEDAEVVTKIPGVPVVRVGVNFEDLGFDNTGKNDNDYNDSVLCFEGKFKVEGTNVVSIRKQTVTGTSSNRSNCNHKVKVVIIHKDGTKEAPIEYDDRSKTPVTMSFKIGSKLEVYMTPTSGCNPGVQRSMHEAKHAVVAPNVCNTEGD